MTPPKQPDGNGDDNDAGFGSASSSVINRLFDTSDVEEMELVLLHVERRGEQEYKSLNLEEKQWMVDGQCLSIERQQVAQEVESNKGVYALQIQLIDLDGCRQHLKT